jgi:uncharacterized protein DUF1566
MVQCALCWRTHYKRHIASQSEINSRWCSRTRREAATHADHSVSPAPILRCHGRQHGAGCGASPRGHCGCREPTTIDQSTQPHLKSWSNTIPNATRRFIVLGDFSNQAVLDREMGLVWEKSPNPSPASDWGGASANCVNKSIADREGWRLPSVVELASLVDRGQSFPTLPAGHPQADTYWTSTTYAENASIAWGVKLQPRLRQCHFV